MSDHETPGFAEKPTLTGERVVLRPFVDADLPTFVEVLADEEALRLTGTHADGMTVDRLREWYGTRNDQPDRLDLAVVDRATGTCVGEAVLHDWDPDNRGCDFRILIGAAGRDRGLGTEAVRLVVGYGFERLDLHRIALEVYAFNPRARRVYEKVGFVTEGVLRQALWSDGRWVDATVMSILSHEWAEHRGRPVPVG